MASPTKTFRDLVRQAVQEAVANGPPSEAQLDALMAQIRLAAERTFVSDAEVFAELQRHFKGIYKRLVDRGKIFETMRGVERFTLQQVAPECRAELGRVILSSADLIRLNKRAQVEKTVQRYRGWLSSVPVGGSPSADVREVSEHIVAPTRKAKFEMRRVAIDQGHKFAANLSHIVATHGGAIAGIWHDRGQHDHNYDARKEHLARSGKVFLVRNSWAIQNGLIRKGAGPYMDSVERPAEMPFCLPGDSQIPFADGIQKLYRRWFEGELAILITASGATLSATLNHPILTQRGWVGAGFLNKGDYVFEVCHKGVKSRSSKANNDGRIPTIAEIFSSSNKLGISNRISGTRHQFHGDGTDSDVNVINIARELSFDYISPLSQCGDQFRFAHSSLSRTSGGPLNLLAEGSFRSSSSAMGSLSEPDMVFRSFIGGGYDSGLLGTSDRNASFLDTLNNHVTRDAEFVSERENAFSGKMTRSQNVTIENVSPRLCSFGAEINQPPSVETVDGRDGNAENIGNIRNAFPFLTQPIEVVEVSRRKFSGHVYNLQTKSGFYIANNLINHNCSCWYEYLVSIRDIPQEWLTKKGRVAIGLN